MLTLQSTLYWSGAFLGDMIKRAAGTNATKYIQRLMFQKAKTYIVRTEHLADSLQSRLRLSATLQSLL